MAAAQNPRGEVGNDDAVTGTVVEFQYVQPHSWIDVKVKNTDGTETQ